MEPEIRYTTTADGVSIAYYTMGEGTPYVVVPGIWSHVRLVAKFKPTRDRTEHLAAAGRMVVWFDGRGMGSSERGRQEFDLEARVRDLQAIMDHLRLNDVTLAGRSTAGPTCVAYAARYPERVGHLVLSNSYGRGIDYYHLSPSVQGLPEGDDVPQARLEFFYRMLARGIAPDNDEGDVATVIRESMTPPSAVAFRNASRDIDVSVLLSKVRVPALVVHQTASSQGTVGLSQELAAGIEGARLVVVDEASARDRAIDEFLGVRQQAPAPPTPDAATPSSRTASALRVILFTDIVGHTEMMQRLGDAKGRDVLRDHERITREALQQHGGDEVKTDGDSFMATFSSPSPAVECTIALQRAFAQHAEAGGEPIVVRMGLNVGEPIEEEGDFFGSAVILASRIRDLAGGGEILVLEAVRHMLSGKNFVFADRGEFAMKGFADAMRLYEVRWRE